MYKIFDRENGTYTFPNGVTKTSAELRDDPQYAALFAKDCVIAVLDGVMSSFETLASFANRYGIDYETDSSDDPNEVLTRVLAKKKEQDDLQEQNARLVPSMVKAASIAALSFTDDQALEVPDLYPVYEVDHAYKKDERFTYNGRLFKVNQAHTSAAQWVPGETGTESLYTCLEVAGDGYLVWTQPTGAHNAYNTGDIVHYPTKDDQLYKSLINGNSWSPDAYPAGWELYTGGESSDTETPTEPSTDPSEGDDEPETSYPDFVQPTGAHDAYNIGDIVKFNGQLYKSTINNNVWSPDAYPQGWEIYTEE